MEKIRDYFENNFKLAYKSVTFHFKKFIWFYIALFIIQSMLGIVSMSLHTNTVNTRNTVTDEYNSHYVFYYMNTNQKYYLQRAANYYFKDEYFFDIKEIKEYGKETENDYKCDVYIEFSIDPKEGYSRFQTKYLSGLMDLGTVYSAPTPLFDIEDNIQKSENVYNLYLLIISVFSLILLSIIYNIRANNYRFDYGIYMAFGADKKKLLNTAFWEMTVITLLTFIPSVIFSALFNFIIAKNGGLSFTFSLPSALKVIILTILINFLAVLFVVVKTALKTPIALIISQDNSNMVHSPRVSAELFGRKPLSKIICLSMKRYAKYYSVLIFSGVLFSALFVVLIFFSNMYLDKQEYIQPQFEVTFSGDFDYNEEDRQSFLDFKGVTGTYKELYTHAMGLNEHILVNKSNTKITANRVEFDNEYVAMDNVVYYAADNEVLDNLQLQKHTGDLYSILNQDDTLVITDSFNNTTHFNFKPGDKIKLADYYSRIYEPDLLLYGKELLKERLRCYVFLYKEYTIGAVIHDGCSDENLKIYMNTDLYEKTTEQKVDFNTVYLYSDKNLTLKENKKLYSDILKINAIKYSGRNNNVDVFVRNLYSDIERYNQINTHFVIKLSTIGLLVLVASSIVWFFAQTLFYNKRNNEFTILRTFGFTVKEIRRIFIRDSLVVSSLSLICYAVLSWLFCYGLYKLMNSWLFYYTFRYSFEIPLTSFIIGGVFTLIFAFTSTYIPYFTYKKKTNNIVPET